MPIQCLDAEDRGTRRALARPGGDDVEWLSGVGRREVSQDVALFC